MVYVVRTVLNLSPRVGPALAEDFRFSFPPKKDSRGMFSCPVSFISIVWQLKRDVSIPLEELASCLSDYIYTFICWGP